MQRALLLPPATHASPREGEGALAALYSDQCAHRFSRGKHTSVGLTRRLVISHCTVLQARLVQDMQKLSPDHFDWATSIVLGPLPWSCAGVAPGCLGSECAVHGNYTALVLCIVGDYPLTAPSGPTMGSLRTTACTAAVDHMQENP